MAGLTKTTDTTTVPGYAIVKYVCTNNLVSGTDLFTVPAGIVSVRSLVVAGAGSGGYAYGGGGGAGGFQDVLDVSVTPGEDITVAVGAGGAGSVNTPPAYDGADSAFGDIISVGGGRGGGIWPAHIPAEPHDGGSGGGGGYYGTIYGDGTPGQGNRGGRASNAVSPWGGGGGGGAGVRGEDSWPDASNNGGDGGDGLSSDITGTTTYYAGGGGGGVWYPVGATYGLGGAGGGGHGGKENFILASPGTPGSGSGGGGGGGSHVHTYSGEAGGSGVVIIKYSVEAPEPPVIEVIPGFDDYEGDLGLEPWTTYINAPNSIVIPDYIYDAALNEIPNNFGVCAVGIIASGSTPDFICWFPVTTKNYVLDSPGTYIIQQGWILDFAQDLTQPYAVATWGVNKDIFNYNDNDDKRKLSTRVVVRGKDINGVSISVSLIGIRAYDNDRQFYNECTYISRKSEGYIYKNNFAGDDKPASVSDATSSAYTTDYASNPTQIYVTTGIANFTLNKMCLFFTAGTPSGLQITAQSLIPYYPYFVVTNTGTYIEVSETIGGSAIDLGSEASPPATVSCAGTLSIDNSDNYLTNPGDSIYISASVLPTGIIVGATYSVYSDVTSANPFEFMIATDAFLFVGGVGFFYGGTDVIINKIPASGESDLGASPVIWMYGWDYVIPTGSVLTVSTTGGSTTTVTTSGATTTGIDSSGVMYTSVPLSSWVNTDYSGRGYLLNQKLYVNKKSDVIAGSDLTLRFGEESIEIDASECGTDPVYGDYLFVKTPSNRVTSSTNKSYPHGVGCMVMYTGAYDLDNPEAGSPVALHGERVADVTVDSNITYGYLDAYATALLLGNGTLYKKATCKSPLIKCFVKQVGSLKVQDGQTIQELSRVRPPRVGDRVAIVDSYGATPEEWEIMSVTIKYDEGMVELILGDYEMNPITSMIKQTNAINRTLT